MFGLTKREQRWKAEQQAAELLVGLVQTTVRAAADIRIAEANAELERLRKENVELHAAAGAPPSGEVIGWQWRRAGQPWPEKMLNSEPALTAPDTEKRAIYAGPTVTYGVTEGGDA